MRQVYVDLTTDNARLPGGDFVGYLGEHNATELLISIPQSMVDASDYQVVVIQAGPLVFKTKHIDEDKKKKTYRDGNTIHTKLSKSLTRVTPISLQVEAYKLDEGGNETLVGKTQTVPHLVLKPSPNGTPAFNYDGSFEDVEAAIEYAHKHDNIDTLEGLESDSEGNLLFNGQLVESIKSYNTPLDFPLTAIEGTFAYAMNDAPIDGETEQIKFDEKLKTIVPRHTSELTDFSFLKKIKDAKQDETTYQRSYSINTPFGDQINIQIMYIENLGSLLLIEESPQEIQSRLYQAPTLESRNLYRGYLFNPGDEFDMSSLSEYEEPLIVPNGWCCYESFESNITLEGETYLYRNYDTIQKIVPIKDSDWLFVPNVWSTILPYSDNYESIEVEVINKLFEVPISIDKKGLYVYDNGSWQSVTDLMKKQNHTVKHYNDLPMDAITGSFGFVTEPGLTIEHDYDTQIDMFGGSRSVYLNPYPMFESRITNIEYELSYGGGGVYNFNPYGVALFIKTCLEHDYAMVTMHDFGKNVDRYLLYSWQDQTITIDDIGTQLTVQKGWSEILTYDEGKIEIYHFDNIEELPHIDTGYTLKGTHLKVEGFEEAVTGFTDLYSSNEYVKSDNYIGLFMKTDGIWMPPIF